jgi:N-sulfoglucosamine sulfohydrolase
MKWIVVLLLLLAALGLWNAADFRNTPEIERPNIILIIADDLGPQLGSYGDPNAHTPNIDRIANEGTRFNAGYVTAASCSPSRGSIFTGLYPHQHGMMGLSQFGTQRMQDTVPKLPNELKKLGYRTAIIGKRHYEPESLFDWDVEEEDSERMVNDRDVLWMNERAMDFIDDGGDHEPFFLVMSYVDPHRGDSDDGDNYGPERNTKFPRVKLGLPHQPTPPSEIKPFPFLGVDSPEIREELADFYGAVDRLDVGVGDLQAELEKRRLWDGAYVVFIGDHGPDVTRGKMAVYEAATRIPFLLKVPGNNNGFVREELVSTIDIFPTLMDAATKSKRQPYQGRSLLPLAHTAASPPWRRYMFTEYITHEPGQFYLRYAVRDERYKLILNTAGHNKANPLVPRSYCNAWWEAQTEKYKDTPIRRAYYRVEHPPRLELYDLQNDPYEWTNLASDPELVEVKERLFTAIQTWREITNDPLLDPAEFAKEARKGLQGPQGPVHD